MLYAAGHAMMIGDEVIADGMSGIIVCDFDNRKFLAGYEGWDMPSVEMSNGETRSSEVMIDTVEAGLVHYEAGTWGIEYVRSVQT